MELNNLQASIDPKYIITAPNVVCECGCKTFTEAVVLKKVSPVLTGARTETLYPIPVFVCTKCGKIPAEYTEKGNAKHILGETEETPKTNIQL